MTAPGSATASPSAGNTTPTTHWPITSSKRHDAGQGRRKKRRSKMQHGPVWGRTAKTVIFRLRTQVTLMRTLATQCAQLQAHEKVEPGGFEPPCRNGQPAASTRVVATLLSPAGTRDNGLSGSHSRRISRSAEACQPFGAYPDAALQTLSGVKSEGSRSSRECVLVIAR